MTKAAPPVSAPRFYLGVFLVSGLLMCLQIIQARIFSVTTWYHLSFLIISMAMFGLTLGAIAVHKGDAAVQRCDFASLMGRSMLALGLFMIVSLAAQLYIPIISSKPVITLMTLPVIALMTVLPYYYAGFILSLAITRAPFPAARTYGADLVGAAAGCLAALVLMHFIDGPSAMLLLSLAAFAIARCFGAKISRQNGVVISALAVALFINLAGAKPHIYPRWIKDWSYPEETLSLDRWNSISRIMISDEHKNIRPWLWGPSPTVPAGIKADSYYLTIDGDAGTPITKWNGDRTKALDWLDYDVTTIAYALPGLKKSGIIGVGGGRDVLSSLHAGITDITALDVNAIQIHVLSRVEPYKSYANLSGVRGLRMINSEARSWFANNHDTFDLIQMSLVDTWAATGAGAFALSENGLYTADAWKVFLSRLNPGGVMTVSRWYIKNAQVEGERLLSLAQAALFEVGAKEPRQHVFAATSGKIITLVLSKDPFTPAQLDALEKRVQGKKFDILVSPRQPLPEGEAGREFASILSTKNRAELDALTSASYFDIRPPVDNRPFFFNMLRVNHPLDVLDILSGNNSKGGYFSSGGGGMRGFANALLNLYIIIIFAALMVIFTIFYPLRSVMKAEEKAFLKEGTAWFFLIGLGFMFVEISLLQRMSIYLGHPSYSLSVVLFSLVLSTGLGSLLSDRCPLDTSFKRILWAFVTAGAISVAMCLFTQVIGIFAAADLPLRALVCVSFTLPLGILLGFGFPTGLAAVEQHNPKAAAWFWGINGAAGVMASCVAVVFNLAYGLETTMFLGAGCYALLALVAVRMGELKA